MREREHSFFETFPEREGRFPFEQAERGAFLQRNLERYEELASAVKRVETELSAL